MNHPTRYRSLLACFLLLLIISARSEANDQPPKVVSTQRIWDAAKHNAFTDLVHWNSQWWCAFREGTGHVDDHGKLRVITSPDGHHWKSAALMSAVFADLRDAKLSVTPAGKLLLSGAGAMHPPIAPEIKHLSAAWQSSDGITWSEPVTVAHPNYWLWRVQWAPSGTGLGFAYRTREPRGIRLYQTSDGLDFKTWADNVFTNGYPNETGLAFDPADGTAYCLLRRDGPNATSAQLGASKPPYQHWSWRDLGIRIGGPALLRLPDGRWLAAGRLYDERVRTSLLWLDTQRGTLTEFLTLPSGGDTSYPGLVWNEEENLLWVSYYSSHEEKTAIYLAKVSLD